jgi:WD40 repeat protein
MQGIRGGLHSLHFSTAYQVLVAAGYENTLSVFQINPFYFDVTLKGKLIGHEALVITFIPIDKTPMIISCDDKQKIKIWDIRNYKCIQTIDFYGRTIIRGLVNMIDIGKIALLGSRIELLSFDSAT